MSDQRTPKVGEREIIEVVRDSTFHRFVADEALMTVLGRDLEVGFLQYGPIYETQTDHGEYEMTESKRVVTEVARMRIAYGDFLNMVMNFLHTGIADGKLKGEAVQKSISEWIVEAQLKTDSGTDDR